MYLPSAFAETRLPVLHGLMRRHPLATWITVADGVPVANVIPFLIDPKDGPNGTLLAHVARANPVVEALARRAPALVVFQGPQAYITPTWYPGKAEHGKVVPTWNYAIVQARGTPEMLEDRAWLRAHVAAMSDAQEAAQPRPWTLDDAPEDFIERMLDMIVGIRLPIDSIGGKWKVGQNRPMADRAAVAQGLESRGREGDAAMAALVRANVPDEPDGGAAPGR